MLRVAVLSVHTCPLAPLGNRLAVDVPVGELTPSTAA